LKCLSYDQARSLAHIYLSHHKLFKTIDVRLTIYIIKELSIKDLLSVIEAELKITELKIKEVSAITASSKFQEGIDSTVQEDLISDKIIVILAMCENLNC